MRLEDQTRVSHALLQYSYLQLLDLLTTIAFMIHGVKEGNPVVRLAIQAAPTPLFGLVIVKVLAILLGLYCWQRAKVRLLWRINLLFAGLVAWNLVMLILGALRGTLAAA
jgi:Domain of unknown function (DUF5658)